MNDSILPHLNAGLNAASFVLLVAGFYFISRRRVYAHRACMLAALAVSCLFLISYVVYHAQYGSGWLTGQGLLPPPSLPRAALAVSFLFLISYVVYHAQYGSVRFKGQGLVRPLYFSILISHVTLAAAIVPLVGLTLHRALRGDFLRHRRIARWTYPLWLYVSATGVLVYVMLYRLYPPR